MQCTRVGCNNGVRNTVTIMERKSIIYYDYRVRSRYTADLSMTMRLKYYFTRAVEEVYVCALRTYVVFEKKKYIRKIFRAHVFFVVDVHRAIAYDVVFN